IVDRLMHLALEQVEGTYRHHIRIISLSSFSRWKNSQRIEKCIYTMVPPSSWKHSLGTFAKMWVKPKLQAWRYHACNLLIDILFSANATLDSIACPSHRKKELR